MLLQAQAAQGCQPPSEPRGAARTGTPRPSEGRSPADAWIRDFRPAEPPGVRSVAVSPRASGRRHSCPGRQHMPPRPRLHVCPGLLGWRGLCSPGPPPCLPVAGPPCVTPGLPGGRASGCCSASLLLGVPPSIHPQPSSRGLQLSPELSATEGQATCPLVSPAGDPPPQLCFSEGQSHGSRLSP